MQRQSVDLSDVGGPHFGRLQPFWQALAYHRHNGNAAKAAEVLAQLSLSPEQTRALLEIHDWCTEDRREELAEYTRKALQAAETHYQNMIGAAISTLAKTGNSALEIQTKFLRAHAAEVSGILAGADLEDTGWHLGFLRELPEWFSRLVTRHDAATGQPEHVFQCEMPLGMENIEIPYQTPGRRTAMLVELISCGLPPTYVAQWLGTPLADEVVGSVWDWWPSRICTGSSVRTLIDDDKQSRQVWGWRPIAMENMAAGAVNPALTPEPFRKLHAVTGDLGVLRGNVTALRDTVQSLAETHGLTPPLVLVDGRGNARGLGADAVKVLADAGVDMVRAASVPQALGWRKEGVAVRIRAEDYSPSADFTSAVSADIEIVVSTATAWKRAHAAAVATSRTARVWVEADIGGPQTSSEYSALLDSIATAGGDDVTVTGLFSRLFQPETQDQVRQQMLAARFKAAARLLTERTGYRPALQLGESVAGLTDPGLLFDMVDLGPLVYGLADPAALQDARLKPVFSLRAPVARLATDYADRGISYRETDGSELGGQTVYDWDVGNYDRPRVVRAGIDLGYSDLPFLADTTRFSVTIAGQRYPVVGQPTMNQCYVQLDGKSRVYVGDPVEFSGLESATRVPGPGTALSAHGQVRRQVRDRTTGILHEAAAPPLEDGAQVVVNYQRLTNRVREVSQALPRAEIVVVGKGESYGHGGFAAVQAMLDGGAHKVGVAHVAEALALRAKGLSLPDGSPAPIVVWFHSSRMVREALEADIELGITTISELKSLVRLVRRQPGLVASVALEVDTMLNRSGTSIYDLYPVLELAAAAEQQGLLKVTTLYQHLASEDPDSPATDRQLRLFAMAAALAGEAGLRVKAQFAASVGVARPNLAFDSVAPGYTIYFGEPGRESCDTWQLTAPVHITQEVSAGHYVSHCGGWISPWQTTIAVLKGAGTDHGLYPTMKNGVSVDINKKLYPIKGIGPDDILLDTRGDLIDPGATAIILGSPLQPLHEAAGILRTDIGRLTTSVHNLPRKASTTVH